MVPSVALALLPKCPACLAAYATVAGVALSVSTADYLWSGVVMLCITSLGYAVARQVDGRSAFVV